MISVGQIPYFVFLPCPTTISNILDKEHPLNASAQAFVNELHTERFAITAYKKFKGIASRSLQDKIIGLINNEFEQTFNELKDISKAISAVEAAGLVHSVFESSDKPEFTFTDLHTSILELAKDLDEDKRVSKIIIVCNCEGKKQHKEAVDLLIKEAKQKEGKVSYLYQFEVLNTKELMEDNEYNKILTKHEQSS